MGSKTGGGKGLGTRLVYYTERKAKNKSGEAWERGYVRAHPVSFPDRLANYFEGLVLGSPKSWNGKWEIRNRKRGNGEMERQRTNGESV